MIRALPLLILLAGCASQDADPATFAAPKRAGFEPVSDALHAQCGSLDCHGTPERNLRISGMNGLRLAPTDLPGGDPTTPAEHDANYRSVVALEPELLEDVLRHGGADRLTLIRKARGSEHHEGGSRWQAAEPGDRCLLGWIAGNVDASSCAQVATLERP